jgi:hypothetical protein
MAQSHKIPGCDVAIVGSGLAALTAKAALAHAGIDAVVFGDSPNPAATWRRRAESIRQTHMRSESDGHCAPRTFPGLAVRDAVRRGDVRQLLLTVTDRYHPSVESFLEHADNVRRECGWDDAFVRARVRHVRPVDGGFAIDEVGTFSHVLVAPGHPGLNVPPELAQDARAIHAYEPHGYAARVAVIGAGMAAATEWRNASRAGAEVISVRRREPLRRPLNLPRHLFTKRGLAAYHRLDLESRAAFLRSLSAPSYPPGRDWDVAMRVTPTVPDEAEQVICATGFRRGFHNDPLVTQLANEHALERANGWLVLGDDATVPALTDRSRTLAISGIHAQWAFPAADTLAGMRYVAHRFVRRCRTR